MGRTIAAGLAVALAVALAPPASAAVAQPTVAAITGPGTPFLGLGAFDLNAMGYVVEEYRVSGTATAFKLKGEPTADGAWAAEPAGTAPYATRIVVVRPRDPKRFNGSVAVEWLNVTAGPRFRPGLDLQPPRAAALGLGLRGRLGAEGGRGGRS